MTQHTIPEINANDVADLLGGEPEPLLEAEAQLRQVRGAIAHAAMLAGERARGAYLAEHPAADAPEADEIARAAGTQYYREVGGWCARMARRDSYNTLQLVDVPDWVELTDSLRDRALQAAEMVLMAYGVTAEDGEVAVVNELAGREYNCLALAGWNAAEHAICALIGDTDGMTGLALAP